jgi:hypothetical protein
MEPFSNQEGRVLRLTSLATVMHAAYQKRLRPLAIKARGGAEQKKEKGEEPTVRRKTGGKQLRRT